MPPAVSRPCHPSHLPPHLAVSGIGSAGRESSYTSPGARLCRPVTSPAGRLALQTCYDLRFPLASNALRSLGADVLT